MIVQLFFTGLPTFKYAYFIAVNKKKMRLYEVIRLYDSLNCNVL